MPSMLDLEFSSERECSLGFHDSQCSIGCKFSGFGDFYFLSSFSYSKKKKNTKKKEGVWPRGTSLLLSKH